MRVSREQFVSIINALIEQIDRDREINKHLDAISSDGYVVFTTPLIDKVIESLDTYDIISWWFWDGPDCGKRAEEFAVYLGDIDNPETKRLVIHNAGELYDYMLEADEQTC